MKQIHHPSALQTTRFRDRHRTRTEGARTPWARWGKNGDEARGQGQNLIFKFRGLLR